MDLRSLTQGRHSGGFSVNSFDLKLLLRSMRKFGLWCTLLLILMAEQPVRAQDFSNKGKEFWLCFPAHVPSSGLANMVLFITSDKNSKGTITVNGYSTNFNVAANQIAGPITIPYANAYVSDAETGTVVAKGIHVAVDAGQPPVVVFAHIYAGFRSEASLILPVSTLGRKYYSTNYYQLSTGNSKSQFQIVATEANTVVQYQLRRNGFLDPLVQTQTLNNPGDVLQIQDAADLTGSLIESIASGTGGCKKIAVFSGSSSLAIGRSGCTPTSYDPLFQQCYPVTSWGKNFGVVPPANNANGYHMRVLASEDNTLVDVNGTNVLLNAGEFYPGATPAATPFTGPMSISANKPVSVAQYLMSANCSGSTPIIGNPQAQGDPEMIILNPVEQSISDINIFSSNLQNIHTKFLCVYIKTPIATSFRINGNVPASGFVAMPSGNGYSYLVEDLTPYATQSFRLTADSGFNAMTYGMGDAESYGYSAGTNVKDFTQFITVANQYASNDAAVACKGAPFNFSMSFPYQPTQITWQFNGLFPDVTVNNPVYDFTTVVLGKTVYHYNLPGTYSIPNAGTYPIRILAQNPTPDGCNGLQEIEYDLVIYDKPTVDFTYALSGCGNLPVNFTGTAGNTAGRPITHWHWNFGDGAVTNDVATTSHAYVTPGSYDVKLAAITDYGCKSDTTIHAVVVGAIPQAGYTVSTPVCAGKTITFTDNSNGNGNTLNQWTWDFGDGPPVVATTNAPQTHSFVTTGPHTVTLQVKTTTGCVSQIFSQTVNVNPNPVADFTLPASICLPAGAAQFTSTSTISDGTANLFGYAWTFGDGGTSSAQNPLHNYTTTGTYSVGLTITSNNGCTDTKSVPLPAINPEPQAHFTVNANACLGAAASFQDASTGGGGTVSQWNWNFGDGGTSNAQNPTHIYATTGTFQVTLNVTTAAGCATVNNSETHAVTVNPLPTVSFGQSAPVCQGGNITFTSTSVPNAGAFTQYNWTVNNSPQGGNANSLVYVPAAAGPLTVGLTVLTDRGCTATGSNTITVNPKPQAAFSIPDVCLPAGTANFTNSSTISDGSQALMTYSWNFGDGGSSNAANPVHVYTTTGPFDVSLTATSNNGCVDTRTLQMTTIYAEPQAAFTASPEVCAGGSLSFTDQSTAPGSSIAQWSWDFGDGSPLVTTQNPAHVFTTAGTYTVTLRVTSAKGCQSVTTSHIATKTITVNANPTANYNLTLPGCAGQGILFTDQSAPNAGVLVKWTWSFGDASNQVLTNATPFVHTYTNAGSYAITLQVETDKGCVAMAPSRNVVVNAVPLAAFTPPQICVNDANVPFTDQSTGNVTAWQWNFGDANANAGNPNTSALQNAVHHFTVAGNYSVQLVVANAAGCKDTVQQSFSVNGGLLTPDFVIENTAALCSDKGITIRDASAIDAGKILSLDILWDAANPNDHTADPNPAGGKTYPHTYPVFGTPDFKDYVITYRIASGQNCVGTVTRTVRMLAVPQLTATAALPLCTNNQAVQLSAAQLQYPLPGTGAFSGTGVSTTGLFDPKTAGAGLHNITYTYTGTNGCANNATIAVTVNPTPVADAGPDRGVLEGGFVVLTPTLVTNIPVTYSWSPATYLDNPSIASPKASPPVDITYQLTVTSDQGCKDTNSVFVRLLKGLVIPNIFSPNGDGVNDRWVISYLDTYQGAVVQIYNRYGQLVQRFVNYTTPWDGKINGQNAPVGTYYYVIDPKNGRKPMTGFVDIIR